MMMRALLFIGLLCTALLSSAQEITFDASVDRTTVATGDPIKLTLTLTNAPRGSGITPPDLGGLTLAQQPFTSSQNMIVNGRISSSLVVVYVLVPTKPGDFTIGSASVAIGQGSIQTKPIKVHVVKGENSGPDNATLNRAQEKDQNLFCTISLSKNKCYVGEQVVATYTLYNRYSSLSTSKSDYPKLNGFWAEEINIPEPTLSGPLVTINGLRYQKAVLRQQLLFPQKSGRLKIEPLSIDCRVNAGFFSSGTPITISSNSVEVSVMDVPSGKPENFIGAVGSLQMQVNVPNTTVKANEAIDLSIKFTGKANLKLIDAPKLNFPTDFESYDPKIEDHVTVNAAGMNGSREFQYLVIPRHEGDYTVGPIAYSYFDPVTAQYRELTSPVLTFHIEKGDGSAGTATITTPRKTDVQQLDKDIRFIRTGDLQLRPLGSHLYGSVLYIAGIVGSPLALFLFIGWHRRRQRQMGDTQGMRRKGADRVARQRLKAAEAALGTNDREAFYTAMGKALEGYFADKFNLGVAQVNQQSVHEKLGNLDPGGAIAKEYAALISDCELARFAPFENKPRQQVYNEAAALITRIEALI